VCLDRRPDPGLRSLHPDPAVQVVAEDGEQQHQKQGHQGPVDQELLKRQGHHEVGDVAVELGIGGVEGRAVPEEDPVVPLADGLGPHDEGQDDHQGGSDPPGVGADDLLIALDELILGVERGALGGEPLRHQEAGQEQKGEDGGEDHHQPRLDLKELEPHRAQAHRGEPEGVGVEDGEGPEGCEQDHQDHQDDDDPAAPPVHRARAVRNIAGGAHGRQPRQRTA